MYRHVDLVIRDAKQLLKIPEESNEISRNASLTARSHLACREPKRKVNKRLNFVTPRVGPA